MDNEKEKSWNDRMGKAIGPFYRPLMIAILITGFGGLFIKGPLMVQDISNRAFTDINTRLEAERFLREMTDKEAIDNYVEHVTDTGMHMPKIMKDSFYVQRVEFEETYKAIVSTSIICVRKSVF